MVSSYLKTSVFLFLISMLALASVSALPTPIASFNYLSDTGRASTASDPLFIIEDISSLNTQGGSAWNFNGQTSYLAQEVSFAPTKTLSVMGWFNTRTLTQDGNEITGSWISRRNAYILSPNTDGTVSFYVFISGHWYEATSSVKIRMNEWDHWAGTYDGNLIKIYRNGALVGQQGMGAAQAEDVGNTGMLYVGKDSHLEHRFFNGAADAIALYTVALNEEEMKEVVASQRPLFYPGVIVMKPLPRDPASAPAVSPVSDVIPSRPAPAPTSTAPETQPPVGVHNPEAQPPQGGAPTQTVPSGTSPTTMPTLPGKVAGTPAPTQPSTQPAPTQPPTQPSILPGASPAQLPTLPGTALPTSTTAPLGTDTQAQPPQGADIPSASPLVGTSPVAPSSFIQRFLALWNWMK